MGSNSSAQKQLPGTLSPITAVVMDLFGSTPTVSKGQYVPTGFGGGDFSTSDFSALTGLLENIPMNETEKLLTGGGFQALGAQGALAGQGALNLGLAALPALLETNPAASIAAARRSFEQETVPTIKENAPQFSASDYLLALTKGGTDLETNIAALKEASLGRVGQVFAGLPAYAEAMGTSLLNNASAALGYGQMARDFTREVSPAGDAYRVLTALQGTTGPAITTSGTGTSKGGGFWS